MKGLKVSLIRAYVLAKKNSPEEISMTNIYELILNELQAGGATHVDRFPLLSRSPPISLKVKITFFRG